MLGRRHTNPARFLLVLACALAVGFVALKMAALHGEQTPPPESADAATQAFVVPPSGGTDPVSDGRLPDMVPTQAGTKNSAGRPLPAEAGTTNAADETLAAKAAPATNAAVVLGLVEDRWGPVAGARVRWKNHPALVKTDRHGIFQLPAAPPGPRRITAAAPGYFIAGVDAEDDPVTIRLEPTPTADWLDYEWIDPAPDPDAGLNCANCHAEIYRQWQTGGHSRAATNRRLMNLYEGTNWQGRTEQGWNLLAEHPHGAGVCTACHAPTVAFHDDAFDDLRQVRGVARHGIHCDYCHKIHKAPTDSLGLAHGVLGVQLLRPKKDQLFFGPLDDDDRGHSVFSSLQQESRMCAACHEGTVFGVPVYTTYSEWRDGPDRRQGHTCQSCHMAPTGKLTNIAAEDNGLKRDPTTLASHGMTAGDRATRLAACLQLTAELQPSETSLTVDVQLLARNAGHRLPTGYIDRQLILVVEGRDGDGRRVAATTGPRLPPPVGEPLTGQVGRLYAKLLTDPDGQSPAPFWRAGVEVADTRLFSNQADRSRYEFPPETQQVHLRLLYRRFWQAVAREKGWPSDEVVVLERTIARAASLPSRRQFVDPP